MASTVTDYTIPTTNIPQTFAVTLINTVYTITVKWNDSDQAGWEMDIADGSQNPIACGLPIITGEDILSGLEYLGIGGAIYCFTTGDVLAPPTLSGFGTDSTLHFQVVSNA